MYYKKKAASFLSSSWHWLMILGLVLSPLVVWPFAAVPYEIPRVFFWYSITLGLLGLTLLRYLTLPKKILLVLPLFFLWLGWLGIAIYSTWSNEALSEAWYGNYYRADGFFTLLSLSGLSLSVALMWQQVFQKKLAVALFVGALIPALWSISDAMRLLTGAGNLIPNWNGAIGVSFGQPNFLAGFLLLALPWSWYLLQQTADVKKKVLIILGAGTILISIGITQSLGSLLGVALCGLFFLVITITRQRKVWLLPLISLVGVALFISLALYTGTQKFQPDSRYRIFYTLQQALQEKPLWGWGWSEVDTAFSTHRWPTGMLHDIYVDKAHSHLLEILVSTGIVGFILYVLFMVTILGRLYQLSAKSLKRTDQTWWITWFMVGCLYVFHTQTNVIGIAEEIIFFVLVGLCWQKN